MKVNVSYKNVAIFIVVLAVILGGAKWFKDTAPRRKAKSETKMLIEYANRQALEIAIIEQSIKLNKYKQGMPKDPNDSN